MDTSKVVAISEERGYGELVNVAVIPAIKGIPLVLASLVIPLGLAIAGFVAGNVVVGIVFLLAIPVVYFGGLWLAGRISSGHTMLYCLQRGAIYAAPDAEPVAYAWSDLRLARRATSGSGTALDIDTLAGERVITLDSSMHDLGLIEQTAQAATGYRG
jgi:hypothetical protein